MLTKIHVAIVSLLGLISLYQLRRWGHCLEGADGGDIINDLWPISSDLTSKDFLAKYGVSSAFYL